MGEVLEAVLVGLVLLFATRPLAAKMARLDDDPGLARLVMASASLKLLAAPAQLYVVSHFYQNVADFNTYYTAGSALAPQFLHLDFSGVGKVVGNGSVDIFTGVVLAITGPNKLAGFLIFSWLAFLGLLLFYRAFRTGFPRGDRRRYALLLFFLPSLLFWSSSIGKEALMTLALGLGALGAARLLTQRRGAFPALAAGLAGAALIRPHEALILFVSLVVAYAARRARQASPLNPVAKGAGLAVLAVAGVVLAARTSRFLGVGSLGFGSITHVLHKVQANNQGTGAGFGSSSTQASTSLLHLPQDAEIVLLRPLPIQAHSTTQLLASLENTLLGVMVLVSLGRIAAWLRHPLAAPYVLMSVVYSGIFIYLFASLGNLGLIARERVLLLPLLLVVLAYPSPRKGRSRSDLTALGGPVRVPSWQLPRATSHRR